jgi:hypothetical protein
MSDTETRPASRIRAMRMLIDKGAGRYDPNRHLDRLIGGRVDIWGSGAEDPAANIARLERALRSQRQLGRAGHWSYDLNRHFGLVQALKAERARALAHKAASAGERVGASTTADTSETGTEIS